MKDAGAIRVFEDVISGKKFDCPGLASLINFARCRDSLCVIRLDRLGRSLKELLETVDDLKSRGINLISLEEKLDTSSTTETCQSGHAPQNGRQTARHRQINGLQDNEGFRLISHIHGVFSLSLTQRTNLAVMPKALQYALGKIRLEARLMLAIYAAIAFTSLDLLLLWLLPMLLAQPFCACSCSPSRAIARTYIKRL